MKNAVMRSLLALMIIIMMPSFTPKPQIYGDDPSSVLKTMEVDYFLDNYDKPKNEIWVCYFWATWCINCIKNHGFLEELEKQFKDQHVRLISLAPDDKKSTWENFLKEHPSGWEQIYAKDMVFNKKFRKTFGTISKLPQLFVIKRNGDAIRVKFMNQLKSTLQQVIEEG